MNEVEASGCEGGVRMSQLAPSKQTAVQIGETILRNVGPDSDIIVKLGKNGELVLRLLKSKRIPLDEGV